VFGDLLHFGTQVLTDVSKTECRRQHLLPSGILWSERGKTGKSGTSVPSPEIRWRRGEKWQTIAKLVRCPNKIGVDSAMVCRESGFRNLAYAKQQTQFEDDDTERPRSSQFAATLFAAISAADGTATGGCDCGNCCLPSLSAGDGFFLGGIVRSCFSEAQRESGRL
jgi:hypothetical protein